MKYILFLFCFFFFNHAFSQAKKDFRYKYQQYYSKQDYKNASLSAEKIIDSLKSEKNHSDTLYPAEVSNLNLATVKLVVLSACETGLGEISSVEGVYGSQRAFKMAGAEYLVLSLWQVPDAETSIFMKTFYKNLFNNSDIRKAFKKTQTEMAKKYDPYYWAAFILVK